MNRRLAVALANFESWDPSLAYGPQIRLLDQVYERLLNYDLVSDRLRPALAVDYNRDAEGLIWRFVLRPDVRFHNGEPMTASAVVFSFERLMALARGPAWILNGLREVRVRDELTAEFVCARPLPLDRILAGPYGTYILPPRLYADRGPEHFVPGRAVGTGPYRVDWWRRGFGLELARHDDHWDPAVRRGAERAVVRLFDDPSDAVDRMRSGSVDVLVDAPTAAAEELAGDSRFDLTASPAAANRFFHFNHQKRPTNDRRVRRALTLALGLGELVEEVYGSGAEPARGSLPASMWGFDPDALVSGGDSAAVRRRMGRPDQDIRLECVCCEADAYTTVLRCQRAWGRAGFQVDVQTGDLDQLKARLTDPVLAPHLAVMTWRPTLISPWDWLSGPWAPSGDWNWGHYRNRSLVREAAAAREAEAADRVSALAGYRQCQRMLARDAAGLFVADLNHLTVFRKGLRVPAANPAYPGVVPLVDVTADPAGDGGNDRRGRA